MLIPLSGIHNVTKNKLQKKKKTQKPVSRGQKTISCVTIDLNTLNMSPPYRLEIQHNRVLRDPLSSQSYLHPSIP